MKILMVCLGNICRSPLAEGILEHKVKENNLDWKVDSAGTSDWHEGENPDPRSVEVAKKYGLDISAKVSRMFEPEDFKQFDKIYVMDSRNLEDVLIHAENDEERSKVKLILNECHPDENMEVPDPYWNDDGFESVYQMLNEACDIIIQDVLTSSEKKKS